MAALVAENRNERRAVSMLAATISIDNRIATAKIRDISSAGAKIQCDILVEIGSKIELSRGDLCVSAVVKWKRENLFGVQFENEILLAEWLPIETPTAVAGPANLSTANRDLPASVISERVREELAYVARAMDNAARLLANDPILSLRHSTSLQELAIGEQMLRELVQVLSRDCAADAVQSCVTGPMRERLLRQSLRGVGR